MLFVSHLQCDLVTHADRTSSAGGLMENEKFHFHRLVCIICGIQITVREDEQYFWFLTDIGGQWCAYGNYCCSYLEEV